MDPSARCQGERPDHPRSACGARRRRQLVLHRRLSRANLSLVNEIKSIVDVRRVSLVHQLLASLPVSEAVTTNFDVLFEQAWRDTGREHAVLPRESARDAPGWLLKLHGSIDDPERIVLSRDDYLRFEGEGVALAGLVQAMLLTRHVFSVGYSLADDNFHRLVHQVRGVVGGSEERRGDEFATAVTPDPLGLANELWQDDVRFVSTAMSDIADVRRLAIFLDYVAHESSAPAAHVLDESYRAVFNDDEWKLHQRLREVQAAASSPRVRPALQRAVWDALAGFGSSSSPPTPVHPTRRS